MDNRTITVGVRLKADENKLLRKRAKAMNMRLSEYIRLCFMNEEAKRQMEDNR